MGAHLLLIDESGLLLSPLVRRTLAPRGQTPILKHKAKHREKVSSIAALSISPKRGHLGLYFSTIRDGSFDNVAVAWFIRQLLRHLRGPVIIVWDRGPMHRGPAIRQLLEDYPRLSLEQFPAYAPELNPVEQVWNYLKWTRLCNLAPEHSAHLQDLVLEELNAVQKNNDRLRTFFDASALPMPRALAS
jgi:transposase